MVRTTRRDFVKAAAASCIALAERWTREASTLEPPLCQTQSLPTSLVISLCSSKPDLHATTDLREPSLIMRSRSPSACEPWMMRISNCSFCG